MIRFGSIGNAVLHVMAGPSGQGHETVLPEVVGEILGLPAEEITLRASDPSGPALVGGGTVGSRSMMSHGGALAATAKEVIRKGLDLAAKELEVSPADVEFSDGRFRVKGTDVSMALRDMARRYGQQLDTRGAIPTPTAFPGGAHVAEVEIDPRDRAGRRGALRRGGRLRPRAQPRAAGGAAARRHRAGPRPGARRALRLRRRAASSSPARSWTTPCRGPRSCRASSCTTTRCPRRAIRSA